MDIVEGTIIVVETAQIKVYFCLLGRYAIQIPLNNSDTTMIAPPKIDYVPGTHPLLRSRKAFTA
jgi:hypothetical protein